MEEVIVNVVFVIIVVTIIGFIMYRNHKNEKLTPSKKQEGKFKSRYLHIEINGVSKKLRIIAGIACLFIIVSSVFGVRQFLINQRYESYLSKQLAQDFVRLTSALRMNQAIYDKALNSQSLSKEQAETLFHQNYAIVRIAQDHKHLIYQFKRSTQDLENNPANNASDFAFYIKGLIWDIAERNGVNVENRSPQFPTEMSKSKHYRLKDEELKIIEKINGMNKTWLQSIARNVKGVSNDGEMNSEVFFDEYLDKGITSDFWVKVTIEMDEETDRYRYENGFYPTNLN